jgi:hypothetical protein
MVGVEQVKPATGKIVQQFPEPGAQSGVSEFIGREKTHSGGAELVNGAFPVLSYSRGRLGRLAFGSRRADLGIDGLKA